nr:MAG TPA: hypothetical protein [Caudoviricetes sp.]
MLIYPYRRIVVTIEEIWFLLRMYFSHTNVATKTGVDISVSSHRRYD